MLPKLLPLATLAALLPGVPMRSLDFSITDHARAWRPVHDGVMGGVSSGRAVPTDAGVRFEGEVSLENNGGFASFRLDLDAPELGADDVPADWSAFDGVALRVRGDGSVYKLSLRTEAGLDGVGWQASFATEAGAWRDVELAFEDLAPTWRGRLVERAGPFDPRGIEQLGVLIADKQAGPFSLELATVGAWRAEGSGPGSRRAALERTAELARRVDAGADAQALADALRGRERLLVVATPGELEPLASLQLGAVHARAGAAAERELRTVHLMASSGRLAGRTLARDQASGLRDLWGLARDERGVVLVGKDGGVKARWSEPVPLDEVFARIDAMPMRQREVRERAEPGSRAD